MGLSLTDWSPVNEAGKNAMREEINALDPNQILNTNVETTVEVFVQKNVRRIINRYSRADRGPCGVVRLNLPDRALGVLLQQPDRLERRAHDRISPTEAVVAQPLRINSGIARSAARAPCK